MNGLKNRAQEIRDEYRKGGVTQTRLGQLLMDLMDRIQALFNSNSVPEKLKYNWVNALRGCYNNYVYIRTFQPKRRSKANRTSTSGGHRVSWDTKRIRIKAAHWGPAVRISLDNLKSYITSKMKDTGGKPYFYGNIKHGAMRDFMLTATASATNPTILRAKIVTLIKIGNKVSDLSPDFEYKDLFGKTDSLLKQVNNPEEGTVTEYHLVVKEK